MTNFGTRAILAALPEATPTRRLRFLLALETFTRSPDGWRAAGTELLAERAGLSQRTARRARNDLVAAGVIDYRRGEGRGHASAYRIKVAGVADHELNADSDVATGKADSDVATFDDPGKVATEPRKGGQPDPVKVATDPDKGGHRNAATSANASGELEPYELGTYELPAARHKASERPGPGGAVSNSSVEGDEGAPPGPATDGRAALSPDQLPAALAAEGQTMTTDDQGFSEEHRGQGQCPVCGTWVRIIGLGQIGRHGSTKPCPGWHQPPVVPVPCVRCGRDGLALPAEGLCGSCDQATRRRLGNGDIGYAACPGCGDRIVVTKYGNLRSHFAPGQPDDYCPGSFKFPAGEVTW